jgi:hypothetical protein
MVSIDLFHPVEPSVYGTATAMDILQVCLAVLLFCAAASVVFWGGAYLLTKVVG